MRGLIAALTVCMLLSGAVVAGCGGGGDDEGTSAASDAATTTEGGGEVESQSGGEASDGASRENEQPASGSQAAFLADANAFCEDTQQELRTQLQKTLSEAEGSQKSGVPQEALSKFAKESIGPAMRAEAEELKALGAPQGDEEQVEAIAASLEAISTEADKDPSGLVTNLGSFEKAQKLAAEYGLESCGKVG